MRHPGQAEEEVKVEKGLAPGKVEAVIDADAGLAGEASGMGEGVPDAGRQVGQDALGVRLRDPVGRPAGRAGVHAVLAGIGAPVGEEQPGRDGAGERDGFHGSPVHLPVTVKAAQWYGWV